MKIAVDKNTYQVANKDNEYIYVFDKEEYKDLIKLNMHCVRYDYCSYVDINLTNYDIDCIKKAKITDKDYDKIPDKINYKFAIIVPNCNNNHGEYKGKTYLQNCIESVLNQTYKDFYLIIVDDCSTDNSAEICREYAEKDNRIYLINNIRKRYNGGSRNVGIEYALTNLDFDYFCFLDSDDWWKHDKVLEIINQRLYGHELMTLGCETLYSDTRKETYMNEIKTYEDVWSLGAVWCTAWARVIRKDKIQYFCESTMMEDRVWSYKVADNINLENTISLKQIVYVWNRMNINNSVSLVRDNFWNASAYCHIGHQLQMIDKIKHKEMIPIIQSHIEQCKTKVNNGIYEQY